VVKEVASPKRAPHSWRCSRLLVHIGAAKDHTKINNELQSKRIHHGEIKYIKHTVLATTADAKTSWKRTRPTGNGAHILYNQRNYDTHQRKTDSHRNSSDYFSKKPINNTKPVS
jgi:hypothetical protein